MRAPCSRLAVLMLATVLAAARSADAQDDASIDAGVPVSVGPFGRYWLEGSETAPDWSIRVPITFVLPGFDSGAAKSPG